MKKLLPKILAGFFLMLMSQCYYDNEEELYEFYNEANPCPSDSLNYTTHIQPIIQSQCAISGCHVAGGSGNGVFDSYAGVKAKVDNGSLRVRVLEEKDMPPSGPLNECQLLQIDAWLNAGAPQN